MNTELGTMVHEAKSAFERVTGEQIAISQNGYFSEVTFWNMQSVESPIFSPRRYFVPSESENETQNCPDPEKIGGVSLSFYNWFISQCNENSVYPIKESFLAGVLIGPRPFRVVDLIDHFGGEIKNEFFPENVVQVMKHRHPRLRNGKARNFVIFDTQHIPRIVELRWLGDEWGWQISALPMEDWRFLDPGTVFFVSPVYLSYLNEL